MALNVGSRSSSSSHRRRCAACAELGSASSTSPADASSQPARAAGSATPRAAARPRLPRAERRASGPRPARRRRGRPTPAASVTIRDPERRSCSAVHARARSMLARLAANVATHPWLAASTHAHVDRSAGDSATQTAWAARRDRRRSRPRRGGRWRSCGCCRGGGSGRRPVVEIGARARERSTRRSKESSDAAAGTSSAAATAWAASRARRRRSTPAPTGTAGRRGTAGRSSSRWPRRAPPGVAAAGSVGS